jgi:outer membrane receptor protein involved in Fe transport
MEESLALVRKCARSLRSAAAVSVLAVMSCGAVNAQVQSDNSGAIIKIGSGPLGDALRAFSARTGSSVIFSEGQVSGLTAQAVTGASNPDEALGRMLEGTGLFAERGPGGAYVIKAAPRSGKSVPADPAPGTLPVAPRTEDAVSGVSELRAEKVIVTGTSLRGLAPESSPVETYSRSEILGSGVTSTEQFIRILPQNFGGGSTEFTSRGLPNDANSQRNFAFGSGANLRGLGAGATLTLVNGARLAPASTIGDFVDVSMIPVNAIDRIEVLGDGASSVYGGDAVAGVVNIILRNDFEGAETSVRYGSVTQGASEEVQASQSLGRTWQGGSLLGTYEYFNRGNLRLADRPDIRPPTLLNGGAAGITEFLDLLPAQERQSLVLSGRHQISDRLSLSSTGFYSDRNVSTFGIGIANTATIGPYRAESQNAALTFLADYDLSTRTSLSFEAGYSESRSESFSQVLIPTAAAPVRDATDSSLWSAGVLANTELFELPGGRIRAALGAQLRREELVNRPSGRPVLRNGERDVSAAFAEVRFPLVDAELSIPGVRRLELNLSGRVDDYSDFGSTTNPKIGLLWEPVESLRLRTSYGTSFAPPKLGLSGALDFGGGVLSYDFIRGILNIPLPDPSLAGVNYLITTGTANDLEPETSRTFTAGFDFTHNSGRHDLILKGGFYDIRYEDRLGITPVPGNLNANFAPGLAFANQSLFPEGTVVFFPSQAEIDAVLASFERPLIFAGGATSATNIGFINNVSLTRNLATSETRGIDAQLAYGMDAEVGRLTARLDASYILDFSNQASASTPVVDVVNTLYNPVDLKLRGQVGLSRGGFASNLVFNYIDDYATTSTPTAVPIQSWSTFDLILSYEFKDTRMRWLEDTQIGLSVTNLFDRDPPLVPPQTAFAITGYDPANSSPLGRFAAISLRKSF